LIVLAEARHARFRYTGGEDDLLAADVAWRQAVDDTAAPATARLTAALGRAQTFVNATAPDWPQVVVSYVDAVRLLPLAAWLGLPRTDQEYQIQDWPAVAVDAAAAAVAAGSYDQATELLDQGRAVLWTHQLHLDTDLRALEYVRPDLARRMDQVRRALRPDLPRLPLVW
jgi:hypothetical protein